MTADFPERCAGTLELLLEAATRAGIVVTGDLRVSERDLEGLLGYSDRYLRQMRDEGRAPPSYRLNGRRSYRLPDVAGWIERHREEP